MKFIYIIKEYIKVTLKCLKYVYYLDKKGTVLRLSILVTFPILSNILNIINARLADKMQLSYGTGIMQYVIPVFILLASFTLLDDLFSFLSNKLSMVWSNKMTKEIGIDQLKKKKDFTIPFTDSSDFEELKQRIDISGEGKNSQMSLVRSFPEFLSIGINIIFSIYIACSYNIYFGALIVISSMPAFYFSVARIFASRKNWESNLEENKYYGVYNGMFGNYQSLKDVKSSNNGDKFIDIYKVGSYKLLNETIGIINRYMNIGFITSLLTTGVILVVQFFVVKDVVDGYLLIGQATLIISQVLRLEQNMGSLSWFLPSKYESVVTAKYLFLQSETLEHVDKTVGTEFSIKNNVIEFKDINFTYTDSRFEALHQLNDEIDGVATKYFGLKKPEIEIKEKNLSNFELRIDNLVINKGEKIAVVGKNGNGKTTFIQLLLNLYQPQSGNITLFGNNLKDLSQVEINKNFSALFQDYAQTPLKTHEYIGLSEKNDINMDRVKSAAKTATADEFIEKWDNQYTQQLGVYMKGVKPSKGQWQKLALARTFYKDSPVIVLDEPTASIDALSSKKIFQNLAQIDKDKTLILISHNMTDIVNFADRIIVFDKGRIVGDGTHEELLKSSPVYKDLYESENR